MLGLYTEDTTKNWVQTINRSCLSELFKLFVHVLTHMQDKDENDAMDDHHWRARSNHNKGREDISLYHGM
jgi:hypothetical protein